MFNLTAEYREKKLRSEIDQFVYFNAGTDVKQFAKNPALISALFLDALSPSQALQIVLRSEVSHVIQNSFEPIEDKLDFIKRLDKDYMNFYETHFLILKELELNELFVFQRTDAKEEMIKIIFDFLKVDRFSPRHFNTVSVLSELIMNAKAVSESHKEIADTGVIKIVVEKTKNLIAFSVFDYAGSLSFNKFLKKLNLQLSLDIANQSILVVVEQELGHQLFIIMQNLFIYRASKVSCPEFLQLCLLIRKSLILNKCKNQFM